MSKEKTEEKPPLHIHERQFTEFVAEQIRQGFNLVPFVGSGISAPSGIVTGQDFKSYLTWVVYRSVARQNGEWGQKDPRLDLRKEGWPEMPDGTQVATARRWVWHHFDRICQECGVKATLEDNQVVSLEPWDSKALIESKLRRPLVPAIIWSPKIEKDDNDLRSLLWSLEQNETARTYSAPPDVSLTTESYICECAIRALHDWRCALDFLARLYVGGRQGLPLWLETVDQAIIDSFNFFITHGRKPNLAHNMLCHLASRARIRTILTTNFDTLLEDAFSELGEHFEVIPVGIRGELPARETVEAQNSIVKLHGGLVDTRAGPSLDERPTDGDLARFFEYVRGKQVGSRSSGFLPGLLLVCGYSASDMRCVQMIKHLLDADKEAKVLWVCHTLDGLKKLGRIFKEKDYGYASEAEGPDDPESRIVATLTSRTDLLFYELYQRLTLSLPRGGFNYQFSPNLPPQRSPRAGEAFNDRSPSVKSYSDQLEKLLTTEADKVVVADGARSLMDPMRTAFEKMTDKAQQNRKNGIWLELEDYPDTASVAHEIFTIIALRLGRFQLDHARLVPPHAASEEDWQIHIAQILTHWSIAPAEWFIVFYGRNGPGKCAGWERTIWGGQESKDEYEKFETFLRALLHPQPPSHSTPAKPNKPGEGFLILYAPYSTARSEEARDRQNHIVKLTEDLRDARRKPGVATETEWSESEEWEEYVRDRDHPIHARASRFLVFDKNEALIPVHEYRIDGHDRDPFTSKPADEQALSPADFEHSLGLISEKWLKDPGQQGDEEQQLNARRALYAATLFRQARHLSAFLSEGVYPCPCRYNTSAIDNDWLRNDHVSKWLKGWSNLDNETESSNEGIRNFFFNKPGGFAWTDHDSRLGVQRLIEGMGPLQFVAGGDWKAYAAQGRARMHFWIGEWYCRAHRATGHADPLLEALYHFRECIHCCEFAMPLNVNLRKPAVHSYRLRLARRALLQLVKALRLGRAGLRLWIQPAAGDPWFGKMATRDVIDGFRRVFETLHKNLPSEQMRSSEWLSELSWEMFILPNLREDTERELSHTEKVGHITSPPVSQHPSPFLTSVEVHSPKDDAKWRENLGVQWGDNLSELKDDNVRTRFLALIETLNVQGKAENLANDLDKKLKEWRDETVAEYSPERLFILAQVTRELAYQFILRAKRRHHSVGADEHLLLDPELARLWVRAGGLCWLTLDLCDELPSALLADETRLRIAASSLYGLALGRLGRFYEAHRRLNEAHAWLSKSGGMSAPPHAAVIKLRRAEVHIFEALRIRCILTALDSKRGRELENEDWKVFLEDKIEGAAEKDIIFAQWQTMYLTVKPATSISGGKALKRFSCIHVAKLDDAWLALESAERVLSGKSHSSLWWGHLHQLRLRLYATHWTPVMNRPETRSSPTRHDAAGQFHYPERDWPGKLPVALAFRKRRDHLAAVRKTYRAGLVASRADPYHAIRLADYGVQAVGRLTLLERAKPKDAQEFVNTVAADRAEDRSSNDLSDSLLLQYRNTVQQNIKRLGGCKEPEFIETCRDILS
jgi:hypothetical protein